MGFTPFDPELARLIAALPQASTLDLYRTEVAIRKLRSEPPRILDVRRQLHLGMTVHFMAEHDARMHTGRIVAMQERALTIDELEPRLRWKGIPYAAIDFGAADQSEEVELLDVPNPRRPSERTHSRGDFKVGDTVTFVDRDQRTQFGRIVRLNQKTASLECDNGAWRVSYGLLQPVVDL